MVEDDLPALRCCYPPEGHIYKYEWSDHLLEAHGGE
jgi:hypothetical protein